MTQPRTHACICGRQARVRSTTSPYLFAWRCACGFSGSIAWATRAAPPAWEGKPMIDEFILAVKLKPGTCRWCGCTERDPCPGGCGWADKAQTLCTSCAHFNKEIQTATGRKKIAQRLLDV